MLRRARLASAATSVVLFLLLCSAARGQANLTGTFAFTPAEFGRGALDIGGTWNGTAEVATGDTVAVTVANDGDDIAYDLTLSVELPTGFSYAAGTASGLPGISASQAGTTLTFSIPPDIDIAVSGMETVSFGVEVGVTMPAVSPGTYSLDWDFGFGTSDDAADGKQLIQGDVLVRAGASVVSIDPLQQMAAVGDQISWDITVQNTGLGGLFAVEIDESAMDPSNAAGSLSFVSLTEASPGGFGTIVGSTITFPYLGPDEFAVVTVVADVTGCDSIDNDVATTDRTLATASTVTASVALDLTQPLISINTSGVAPTFTAAGSFNGDVQNMGLGEATDLVLDSSLENFNLTISNVSPDWSYNPANGEFTLVANGGTLANGATSQLDFDATPDDACAPGGGGTVVWLPSYLNVCGDPYSAPVVTSAVSGVTGQPMVELMLGASDDRLEINAAGQYTLTLSWTERDRIATDPLVVTQVLPPDVQSVVVNAPSAGTASCPACAGGSTITWSIPLAALAASGTETLTVDFEAPADPCAGGQFRTSTANVSADSIAPVSGAACPLSDNASVRFLVTNAPTGPLTQQFNAATPPGGTYETGFFDSGNGVYEEAAGEGEFITYTALYEFGNPYTGTWAGSTYKDFLAGLSTQQYVTGTAMVSVDSGALQPLTVSAPDSGETGIKIDLAQIQALAGDANVQDHDIRITYQTVVNDSFLGGAASGSFTEIVELTVGSAAGDGAACNMGEFTQGDFVNVARGQALISAAMPSQIDLCEEFNVTLTVANGTPEKPSNLIVTFDTTGDYEVIPSQTPVYTGDFLANSVTYDENLMGGVPTNPTFALDPSVELATGGTIRLAVRRVATSGTTPTPVSAMVEYDDQQTKVAGLRAFSDTGSDSPLLVREAQLNLTVTPQSITVTRGQVNWLVDVTNGGAGVAYDATLVQTLPAGLTPNAAATDLANMATGLTVAVNGQEMTWDLGDLASAAGQNLTVVADVDGSECMIPAGANSIVATWGCGDLVSQTSASADPNFAFAVGALQVLHDTTNSRAVLCETTGEVILIVKSTGASHVESIEVQEDLATASTGISYVVGSSMFGTDGMNYSAITGSPTVSGAGVVTWDSTNIAALADLAAANESGGVSTIYILFRVEAVEAANASMALVTVSASGDSPCGDAVTSPGSSFMVPLERPDITVEALGENRTANGRSSSTVTGTPGDMVRWSVTVANAGDEATQNARMRLTFPGSAAGTGTLTFPDMSTASVTSGQWFTIADVPSGTTDPFELDYNLGTTCVNDAPFTAEVTWGCTAVGANVASALNTPTQGTATAVLDMEPDFGGEGVTNTITRLSNGRAEIVTTITNAGGEASSLVLDGTLANFTYDATFATSVTGGLTLGSVTFPSAPGTEPRFTLNGTLRGDESAILTYRVVPTTGFDVLSDPAVEPEDIGMGDSAAASNGTIHSDLSYDNGCGAGGSRARSTTINPHVPDLDLFVDVDEVIVDDMATYTFEFSIENTGETNSIAENIVFTPIIGSGWSSVTTTVTAAGTGGSGMACGATCTAMQIGSLSAGQVAIVRVVATANDNGNPLTMLGQVNGNLFFDDGSDTSNDYSLDQRQSAVVGFELSQTITATSETFTSEAGDPRPVAVGEEVTYRIEGRWFGGEPVTNIEIKNTLPSTLGFVSASDVASSMGFSVYSGPTGTTAPANGDTGPIRFVLSDLGSGVGTFSLDLVARVLNVDQASGSVLTNPTGVRFDAFGVTYYSNNALDNYTGDVADTGLHAETNVEEQRADVELVTTVRNVTQNQMTYSTDTMGDAGDVLEYRTVTTNVGDAAAFDVVVTENPVSAKLLVQDGAGDGIDNDGDGATDEADEGTFVTGADGTIVFNGTDNAAFDQMDPTDTVTLLYRVVIADTVEPDEMLASAASVVGTSLDGGTGNQTGTTGTVGATNGAEQLSDSDSAGFEADMIDFAKVLVTTSEGTDTSTDVVVGELVQYRVTAVLPQGQASSFKVLDSLPSGLALVATPAVTYGWTPAPSQPTITPGVLPADGGPLAIEYDFGTLMVPAGTDPQRTITIDYYTQVRNVAGNVGAVTLANRARYMFGATTGSDATVTVTVREPAVAIMQSVSNGTPTDAGAILTYTVTATSNGDTTAQDLDLRFTLPPNTSYVGSSTIGVSGPAIGEPEVTGGVVVWGRTQASPAAQDLDLVTTGGSNVLQYTFQVALEDGVEPDAVLTGAVAVNWTSLDGASGTSLGGVTAGAAGGTLGERDGSGTVNDYASQTSSMSTVQNAYANRVTASGDTVTGGGFRIGDLVTYTIEVDLQEGTTSNVVIEDVLPAGLAFESAQILSPASGNGGFTFTQPTGANLPIQGDTGTLQWVLGTVVNEGDNGTANDTLTLVYQARVLDTGGIAATQATAARSNSVRLRYDDAADNAEALTAVNDSIDIVQPTLVPAIALATGQAATVGADEPVRYELTLENTGDAPAYSSVARAVLPAFLRDTTPTTVTATIAGMPVTLAAPTYDAMTGIAEWALADGQVLEPGAANALVLTFEARTDTDAGAGSTLIASGTAGSWASKPSADATERREYGAATPVTRSVGVPVPTDLTKVGSVAGAAIGQEFTYTVTVPGTTVDASLFDVFVLDALPANYTLVGATTNAATLGTTLVDGSSGQSLSYKFEEVPANTQAIVTLTVRFDNEIANQDTLDVANTARFTYASADGDTQSGEISVMATDVSVTEPDLAIDKAFDRFVLADMAQGLQAGDRVIYDIVVTNNGDAPAYDIVIDDLADEELINPLTIAAPENPGAATTVGTVAGVTTYRWTVPGPILPATTYSFELSLGLDTSAQPQQMIANGAAVTWTSLPGASAFERDGADGEGGALDDYAGSENAPTSVMVGNVVVTKVEDPAGDSTYAPGETIEYDLGFSAGQGTISGITLRDLLPAGLVYVSSSLVVTQYERPGGGAVTFNSEPSAGDVGALDFVIGSIESTGTEPRVAVTIIAYVDDVPANMDGLDLTNSAALIYDDPDNMGSTLTVGAQTSPVVTVIEPGFGVAFDAPASADLGAVQDLQLRVDNTGGGAAWQPTITFEMPVGMRDYDPLGDTFTVAVTGGRAITLAAGTDYTTSYDAMTGRLVLTLTGASGFIGDDEELVVDLRSRVDENATDGAVLEPVATVTQAFSTDTTSGTPDGLRTYSAVFGAGTTGTANAGAGDDETDNAQLTAAVPVVAMVKSVSAAVAEAGTALSYSIQLTNTGSGATAAADFVDDLDVNLAPATLENVMVTPPVGTLVVDPTGGLNGTGQIRIDDLILGANQTVTITFDCSIRRPLTDGTVVTNQASLSIPFFTADEVSDSANAADDDGVDTGNDPGDGDDDDGTSTLIGARPILSLVKTDMDADGAPLAQGDVLTYVLEARNDGNETAVNAALTDTIPSNTTYVAGSTTLNNMTVTDVGGTSPLVGGMVIQSPGEAAGILMVDEPATVTFQVTIAEEVEPGTVVTNQASLLAEGEASGAQDPVVSDDPDTSASNDPTRSVVAGGSSVDVTKLVADLNGGSVAPGDVLVYTIVASNFGDTDATGVRLEDAIPAGATYEAGSMMLTPDGGSAGGLTDADDGDAADFDVTTGGAITLVQGDLAGGASFTLEFRVTVDGGTASGTPIANQGVLSRDGAPDEPTDDDGNDSNGDAPTTVIVGSEPLVRLTKTVIDLNGGLVEPGDVLRYTLETRSLGAVDATGVVITDPIPPAGTTYVVGSTVVNGAAFADAAGPLSPLVGGVSLGSLEPGQRVMISADVEVLAGETPGTVISNQGSFSSTNAGSGVSDSNADDLNETGNEPGDPNDDDPTVVTIGGGGDIASVSGRVWRDFDHDRVFTGSSGIPGGALPDEPVASWTVEILQGGLVIGRTTTGEDGAWRISGLPAGHGYEVQFLHPTSGAVYGNPQSNHPGASVEGGQITGIYLAPGANVLEQDLPLDPSGIIYNSVTRMPVEGAIATIAGPPGFDPSVHLPLGQQGQSTGTDGFYQFDLLAGFPSGDYTITVAPPLGFLPTFPSTLIAPTAGPLDPTGNPDPFLVVPNNEAPMGGDPTVYYLEFSLEPGDPNVLNNHIAIDPILEGSIALTKTTPKRNVVRGDLVPWSIGIRNLLDVPLPPSEVIDTLPPGFKYLSGSATVDGIAVEPTIDGRMLTWAGIDFQPGQLREIVIVTVVGSGVGDGRYLNTALTREPFSQELLSNVGTAEIFVVPDPVFDCTDILGKVFDDANGDGYQNDGEKGIAGVRLVTARGLVVTTDAFGRYHIACPELAHELRGSNFILKVDERSLPSGYRMTTENPRVIRLTRGKFVEADFGAAVSRVMRFELGDSAFVAPEGAPDAASVGGSSDGAERTRLDENWVEVFRVAAEEIEGGTAVVRLGYVATDESDQLVAERMQDAVRRMREAWSVEDSREALRIEREVLRVARADRPASVARDNVARNLETAPKGEVDLPGGVQFTVDGDSKTSLPAGRANAQRRADVALANADVRLQADGLDVTPRLNINAVPSDIARSGTVTFVPYSNYWSWIDRAELRLFGPDTGVHGDPMATIALDSVTGAKLVPSSLNALEGVAQVQFVLRVYDATGRYDETRAKVLRIVPDEAFDMAGALPASEYLVGYGESHLQRQRIPVRGGSVTISGRNVPVGSKVLIGGQPVPVTGEGVFVTQMIVGEGTQMVDVAIEDSEGARLEATREVVFPKDEWFYVAMGDLTVGGGSEAQNAVLLTGDEQYDGDVYVNGRLAFYLKGKIKGEHLLTVSLDTRDRPLDELLSGLDDTDPRTLMRFIDPDQFYPVYGDDSTTTWDAPTQGRFYVRLERDDYKVLWGNFKTRILDTELAQIDRGLYGLQGQWRARSETSFGEARTEFDGYAASPESAAAREELRGTGGSLYYLRHRELVLGSERVRVEIRDKDSGIAMDVRPLLAQQDYEIDYLAGRILLTQPLPSTAGDGLAVQNSSLAGNPVYLVARYEFVPQGADLDALSTGGRISHWLVDSLQVGATVDHQEQVGGDRDMLGIDVTWRKSADTYVKAEFASTDGQGDTELTSLDGGFSFGQPSGANGVDASGEAFRVEAAAGLEELGIAGLDGRVTGVVQNREGGFSATGQSTQGDSTQISLGLVEPLGERRSLRVDIDMRDEDLRTSQTAIDAQYEHGFGDAWTALAGVRFDDVESGALSGAGARDGRRTDLALRLGYDGFDKASVYAFGQLTLDRTGSRTANNRYGVGGDYALTERLTVDGEISGGNGGFGARVGSEFGVTDRTDLYLAYGLDADRSDTGLGARSGRRNGTLTVGAKHRYSDTISVFGEERYDHGDGPVGLTHAYGADYSPNDRWTAGVLVENGQLEEAGVRQLERSGFGVNVGFTEKKTRLATAFEWREDESVGPNATTRTTWLTRNNLAYQASEDWRLLANLDLSRSDTGGGALPSADFTELGFGWAFRPVDHERVNALFRYTYHEDLPSPGQVDGFGGTLNFAQRSHVLSADVNYDLSKWVTIGGKVGMRYGELKATKGPGVWFDSRALLYALRADWHVVHGWDATVETRKLDVDAARDNRLGVLAAIWKHMGENGKLGVGYSFADFSDDLTDLDYDHQGWFINLIGKF